MRSHADELLGDAHLALGFFGKYLRKTPDKYTTQLSVHKIDN